MSEAQPEVRHRTVMDDEARHVSRVYAEALYRSAEKENLVEPVLGELEGVVRDIFDRDRGLELFFSSAAIGRDRKGEVIRSAFEGRVSGVLRQFFDVLNEHDRLDALRAIASAYRTLYDKKTRRVVVHVTSAVPLTDDERARVVNQVKTVSHLEPVLQEDVDPDVLGGVIIRINDWVYDASVRSRLQAIRQQLIERSSHGIQSGRDRFSTRA
jgi:F-type H+-transporting ATPase subunit delta